MTKKKYVEIIIRCDNAAFDDSPAYELARMLRKYADDLVESETTIPEDKLFIDINGNAVGQILAFGFKE